MENTVSPATEEGQILASWQAPVLPRHERGKRWYAVSGAVVLVIAAYGIMSGSWPLAVVSLLCGAMYYLMRDHVPPQKTIVISDKGVALADSFTRWEDLQGFWFLPTPDYTELHIVPLKARASDIVIQTGTQNLQDLRVIIGSRIPEQIEKQESFLDALIRIAKL